MGQRWMPNLTEAQVLDKDQQGATAARLARASGLSIYDASVSVADAKLLALGRTAGVKRLLVAAQPGGLGPIVAPAGQCRTVEIEGVTLDLAAIDLRHEAAVWLRQVLPWTAPRLGGLTRSVGLGDRLGLATPGHVRAVRGTGCVPYFAQQSIREMTRTERTPAQVLDDATWGVFQAGWREGFGSDADHLKTLADVDACAAVGFTMFTIDPGDHVHSDADAMDASALASALDAVPWAGLEISPADWRRAHIGRSFPVAGGGIVTLDEQTAARAVVKYGGAIAHTAMMFRHVSDRKGGQPFELEVSVDETAAPTSIAEHYLIAAELKRLDVRWIGLAPRFIGEFQKGIDYRGDLSAFEQAFAGHVAVARTLGPYKLSLHSGSDKFSIYPIVGRLSGGLVHLKTAGTSYLEALRVVARRRPALFREILDFAFSRFDEDRATYHISARLDAVPRGDTLPDSQLESVLDVDAGRQLLHVTFGSVLTGRRDDGRYRFRDDLRAILLEHEEDHHALLAEHLARHVRPLVG